MAVRINSSLQSVGSFLKNTLSDAFSSLEQVIPAVAPIIVQSKLEELMKPLTYKLKDLERQVEAYIREYDRTIGPIMNAVLNQFNAVTPLTTKDIEQCYPPHLLQDPYITGYYVVIIKFPQIIEEKLDLTHKIMYLCKDVTQVDMNVNVVERPGFGQRKTFYVANIDYTKQVTCTFYDNDKLGVTKAFQTWMLAIQDLKTGIHLYESQVDIKGWMITLHMDAKLNEIKADMYAGIIPVQVSSVPQSRDQTIRETPVTFNFDLYIP